MKVAKSKDEDDNEGVDECGGKGGDVGVDEDGGGELIDFKLLRGFGDRLTNVESLSWLKKLNCTIRLR